VPENLVAVGMCTLQNLHIPVRLLIRFQHVPFTNVPGTGVLNSLHLCQVLNYKWLRLALPYKSYTDKYSTIYIRHVRAHG
jgi:hypothetical protein